MKSDNIIHFIMLFILLFITAASSGERASAEVKKDTASLCGGSYILDAGRVYRIESGLKEIPVEGNILGINYDSDGVCYIREAENGWFAGRFKEQGEELSEYPLGPGFRELSRLMYYENVFYFLAYRGVEGDPGFIKKEGGGADRILVRFDPGTGEKKLIAGVEDFSIAGNRVIVLYPSGLDCNGVTVPVSLSGSRYIDRIADGRFVFLANGSEIEIIDILSERNIYIYREGKAFPYSSEYNIILEFSDSLSPDNENMIYYQINLNGVEAGRTETSSSFATKSSMIKAETGRYCVIKTERWELDKAKGRYVRANNIYQPDEMKLFVPENRIIRVRLEFDGEKYRLNQSVYEN